jgi:hypothetical protein
MSHHSTSLVGDPDLKRITRIYWFNFMECFRSYGL